MLTIPGPAGSLDALIDAPASEPRAAAVFAHPHPQYGGTMHTTAVFRAAKAIARAGCAVLRFNFRGVGGSAGTFDHGIGEAADFRAALDFIAGHHPGLPLWAVGMSFGSWVALETGAEDPRVSALIGIASPVDRYEYARFRASTKPKFLVHGEADELVPLRLVWGFYGALQEPKELAVIDAAGHLFDGRTMEVADTIEGLLGDFATGSRGA
jgi:alpha/beta superfamily hydrolase